MFFSGSASAACTSPSASPSQGVTVAKHSALPDDRRKPATDPKLRTVKGRPADVLTPDLDRLIHERMRLGIVSALAVNEELSFNDLKKLMKTTDGNLSVHARKL